MVVRRKRNAIVALRVGDIWLETPSLIRGLVENFFANHFMSRKTIRPSLDGVSFPTLSQDENLLLSAPFSLEEIHSVGEIRIMFDQFHGIGCLPKSLLAYFVTLIPKVNSPFDLGDFRPISLLGLAKVMNSLVAPNQSAFIKGRNLVDGVLVVNEVVDLAKRSGKQCLIFKVDFEKAYDSVEWEFLEYMLRRFGFCEVWIGWIKACVFGGNLSVLVNGSPTGEISIQRGLKQGDPLGAFLFLLVAEGFGGAMRKAVTSNLFHGFKISCDGPSISHLQYADDTLCIGEASVENLWTLKAILRGFELASGLKVNFWKSCLMGINVSDDFMEMASSFLNCIKSVVPFKYLGLPVGANPRRMSTWDPLVASLRKKLNSWRHRHISLGGRISLGGVNGGKKLSWIKWKMVCQDKNKGGLGVQDIKAVNLSLLMKWRWRLLLREDVGLWKEVLVAKYGAHIVHNAVWPSGAIPRMASLWWKDICDLEACVDSRNWVAEMITRSLGNGASTRFWSDKWIGDSLLSVKFPRLYSLSTQKEATVRDLVVVVGERRNWNFLWRRRLFLWEEDSVSQLLALLENLNLSNEEDKWRWVLSTEGEFSVKSAYESLFKEIVIVSPLLPFEAKIFNNIWGSPAPSKVIAFSWQLLHNRVPTKDNLSLRGILHQESGGFCVWCGDIRESSLHLFLHCKVALVVWYAIFKWLGVVIVIPPNLFFLFDCLCESALTKKSKKGFALVWHSVIWSIWLARNNHIFNGVLTDPLELVEAVKVLSWRWSADRLKISPCLFYEWSWDPALLWGSCSVRVVPWCAFAALLLLWWAAAVVLCCGQFPWSFCSLACFMFVFLLFCGCIFVCSCSPSLGMSYALV
ncbi:LINE-1 reverse transcriptase like [Trifolium medium]|uniref:LINE-1 reverse transcriptase like n=1 Tax=Trifolium medium TaxID=97028 RepID=A0A392LWR3_9FABA|nr:LINE-1 reverse transcriptase like [Trifolium medium]